MTTIEREAYLMKFAIQTKNLCKEYKGELRVNHLNLNIPAGCVYGFLGPNGAGKSTTMKMMLGLVKPTDGSVTVLGKTLNDKKRLSILSQTGSLIESPSYYGHLSGKENLEIVASLKNVSKKEIAHALEIVHLTEAKDKKVKHYSLGMKQRLGIACALLGHPKLILLDEPTNGLDPAGIQEIRELICTLPKEFGMTVLVSSHLLSEIDQMATEIGIIDHGELLFENSLHVLHSYGNENLVLRTSDTRKSIELLRANQITCQPIKSENDGKIRTFSLPLLSDTDLAPILHLLTTNEISVFRIEESKKSLEYIFLDITGRSVCLS